MELTDQSSSIRVKDLIALFRSHDAGQRQRSREALVAMGSGTIPHLSEYCDDENDQVRWEVAKTLGEVNDASSTPALLALLSDDVPGVRWLAAEGLIQLNRVALVPLLKGLQKNFHSTYFREGAHHVLRELARTGALDPRASHVLDALEGPAPAASVAVAATEALRTLESTS